MGEPADLHAPTVLAAGGLVCRTGADGEVEVLLVHRPRYDDWSYPKGKCDPGESFEQTAVRELREETGLEVAIDAEVADVRYVDHKDRPKLVRYYAMTPLGGSFTPNDEVDEVRWLAVPAAGELLSYPHDAALLGRLPSAT